MRAQFLVLFALTTLGLLGLSATPPQAQSAADPTAAVPPVHYESITAGTKSYRPVEPLPWPDVNRRVAPPGATGQSQDGAMPGAKHGLKRDAPPTPKGPGER